MTKRLATFRKFLMNGFTWNPKLVPDFFKPVMAWYQKTGDDAKAGMALMRYMAAVGPIIERPMGEGSVREMLIKVQPWKGKQAVAA